ncbi:MAG: YceD family protein [Candidatus Limnocylindrales bacterium]
MTVRPPDGPFVVNAAGLLSDEVGAERGFDIDTSAIELPDELVLAEPIRGHVRLVHENRGVFVDASLTTALAGECSRCLRPLQTPVEIRLREEYLPTLDLGTGRPVTFDDEPDALRLTDHHEVDLEPSVRDAISLAEPIAPLDRPDCPGLCLVCGLPLDEGVHDHPVDDIDPRMAALRGFVPTDEE